jgi:hypothetical protein
MSRSASIPPEATTQTQRPDGSVVRPDLELLDDPQTDESARLHSQCATRERIVAGAVLGLAGPGAKIVVAILDRKKQPEWIGERTKLIRKIPEAKLWDRYGEMRAESLRRHGDIPEVTAFSGANRAEMDDGAEGPSAASPTSSPRSSTQ